jgi:hypothetical protein
MRIDPELAAQRHAELKADYDARLAPGGRRFESAHEYDWYRDQLRELARIAFGRRDPMGVWHGRQSA